jgi:hypothetical protein
LCALSSVTPGASDCRVNQSEWILDTPQGSLEGETIGEVHWEEVDPAVLRVPALRLADTSQNIGTQNASTVQYCRYDEGVDVSLLEGETVSQIFLTPPRNIESLVEAHLWAQNHGLVVLPARPCSGDLEFVVGTDLDTQQATAWRISSPRSEQVVNGQVTISGTANFQPNTRGFYQVELGIPNADGDDVRWVPVGGQRTTPVVNGQLAILDATTLVPGKYFLRLTVTQNDRVMDEPYVVSIRVGGVQAVDLPDSPSEEAGRVVDVSKMVNPSPEQAPPPQVEDTNKDEGCTSLRDCP